LRTFLASSTSKDDEATPAFLISSLANIAWLLNLRGSDIKYNPFFYSYLLVRQDDFVLWPQRDAVTSEVKAYVEQLGGTIGQYEDVWSDLGGQKARIFRFHLK
jgi:Xaa-Pro aminopeptidase